jgi:hypothetical protein
MLVVPLTPPITSFNNKILVISLSPPMFLIIKAISYIPP